LLMRFRISSWARSLRYSAFRFSTAILTNSSAAFFVTSLA
jgi:hypothetical protein